MDSDTTDNPDPDPHFTTRPLTPLEVQWLREDKRRVAMQMRGRFSHLRRVKSKPSEIKKNTTGENEQ